mmetsp:Transcript_45375/g.105983  ORF Transcript_45375/g.105983 Transcript_45375/m.105983 type:complete len:452 (-) Transcript_45375:84-1439(-)
MQTWAPVVHRGCHVWQQQSRFDLPLKPPAFSLSRVHKLSKPLRCQAAALPEAKPSRVTLWTLLAISCLNLMSFTAMFPLTPKLMKRYSVHSEIGVGLVASSFALGRFCTTSLWPILSDFIGRKKVLFMALLGGVVGSALQGVAIMWSWPFTTFLIVRGVCGMFSGIVPVVKAYIVDAFEEEEVPKILAYREAAGTMAFIFGPALGGALASRTLSAPLFFSAGTGAIAAALALKVLPEPTQRRRKRGPKKSAKSAAGQFSLLLAVVLLGCSFVWACTRTCFHAYFPLLLARRYALPLTNLGAVLTGISLTIVVVQIAGFERCRQRHGLETTMVLGALLVIAGLGALFCLPVGTSLAGVFTCGAVYGAGCALISPALPALLVQTAPAGRCGALLGIDSAIVNFGRIVAPSVFGLLYHSDQELTRTLWATKVATAASAVLFVALACGRKQDPQS